MGCNNSKISVDASEVNNNNNICQKQTNSAFESPIDFPISYADFINSEVQFRILLIGPENSGKTTLWNNLEINILNSNKDYENESKTLVIKKYLIKTSKSLFRIIESKGIEADTLNIKPPTEDNLTDELSNRILSIWNNNKVQTSYQQNDNFGFYSNESFFLSNTRRIASNNYKPTKEDILKCYFHQEGAYSSFFLINNTIKTELIDIAHQNILFYENNFKEIDYLIFTVSLPDFDRELFNESIDLFHQTLNSPFFMNSPILLLLNKTDLFERKLKSHPQKFRDAFPDFNGKIDNTDSCILHIKNRIFQEIPKNRNTETYWVDSLSSCAIDEQSCRKVFQIIARRIIGLPKKQEKAETPKNDNSHKSENQISQEKGQQSTPKQKTPKEPSEKKSNANSPRDPTRNSHKKSSSSQKETKNPENSQTKDSPPKNKARSNKQQSKSKNKTSKQSSEKSISDSSQKKQKTIIKIISDKPLKEKADDEISIYEYASEYISETDSYSEYYNSSYFY